MIPPVTLQAGSNALILTVAVVGVVVFIIVLLLRMLPLIHKPRVVMRVASKPLQPSGFGTFAVPQGQVAGTVAQTGAEASVDRAELGQAKARWEQLVREAESNEHLTPEQRKAFVGEAWKRIEEISRQLEAAA